MEIILLIAMLSSSVLWLSHKLHIAYVSAVAREERSRNQGPESSIRRHIGPRCFVILDASLLLGLLLSLDVLAFGQHNHESLRVSAMTLTRFSVLVALWMLLQRDHMERFYSKLAALGQRRGDALDEARERGRISALVQSLFMGLAFVPLLLEAGGHDLVQTERSVAILLFSCFFLLPQLGLLALAVHRLLPLRRASYQRV